jgi:hypothetical protein
MWPDTNTSAPTRVNGTNAATGFVKAGSSIFRLSNVSYTDKPFSSKETAPPLLARLEAIYHHARIALICTDSVLSILDQHSCRRISDDLSLQWTYCQPHETIVTPADVHTTKQI